MHSDFGYVVVRPVGDQHFIIEVCAGIDETGRGTDAHAVHSFVNKPVIHRPELFKNDDNVLFSTEPQEVFVSGGDSRVQVDSLASRVGSTAASTGALRR